MIPTAAALDRLIALAEPVGLETANLTAAVGRVLRETPVARRTQPPFDAASMDGYAVRASDLVAGVALTVVGEVAAGDALGRPIAAGEAARIFTGAPVPAGADAVAIQEDARRDGDVVRFDAAVRPGENVRPAGGDFRAGDAPLTAPRRLSPEDVALAAAMGWPWLTVARRPRVAVLSLGDELRLPGEPLGPSDVVASNAFGVAALLCAAGADVAPPPPIPDALDALRAAIRDASGFDAIVTLGGASDGAHDLARAAFAAEGADLDFYKVAMRPGKPIAAGRLGRAVVLGLPGNPVSSMVGARLLGPPLLDALQGAPARIPRRERAPLAADLPANGPREHFMRATISEDGVRAAESQDSSLLTVLSEADALLARPPNAAPAAAGDMVDVIRLRDVGFEKI